jgi:hypothetical protein
MSNVLGPILTSGEDPSVAIEPTEGGGEQKIDSVLGSVPALPSFSRSRPPIE